jgi:hypothetical protein
MKRPRSKEAIEREPGSPSRHLALAGFRIGVLVLDTAHELVVGNVQNAQSFHFPVLYEVVRGVTLKELMQADHATESSIIERALALQQAGVSAVVGACGSFANYQKAVAGALRVPVFLSILLEIPLILLALPPSQQLGVVFADPAAFSARMRQNCGIDSTERLVIVGMTHMPAFQPVLAQTGALDSRALCFAVVELARRTLRQHPAISAWLLQCSDLPPYASAIRAATGLPVFDMVHLINHVHSALEGAAPQERVGSERL